MKTAAQQRKIYRRWGFKPEASSRSSERLGAWDQLHKNKKLTASELDLRRAYESPARAISAPRRPVSAPPRNSQEPRSEHTQSYTEPDSAKIERSKHKTTEFSLSAEKTSFEPTPKTASGSRAQLRPSSAVVRKSTVASTVQSRPASAMARTQMKVNHEVDPSIAIGARYGRIKLHQNHR